MRFSFIRASSLLRGSERASGDHDCCFQHKRVVAHFLSKGSLSHLSQLVRTIRSKCPERPEPFPHIQNEALTQGKLSLSPPPLSMRSLHLSSPAHSPTLPLTDHPPDLPPIPHRILCSPCPPKHHSIRSSGQLQTPGMQPNRRPRLALRRRAPTRHRRQLHGYHPHSQLPDFPQCRLPGEHHGRDDAL